MAYLVRKFTRNKWGNPIPDDISDVSADAITSCLRTTGNTLSVWRVDSESDFDEAILAVAGTLQRVQAFDILAFDESEIASLGLRIQHSLGATVVSDLCNSHADIVDLSYQSIGMVANEMRRKIVRNEYRRILAADIKRRLKETLENGRVRVEELCPSLKKDLGI